MRKSTYSYQPRNLNAEAERETKRHCKDVVQQQAVPKCGNYDYASNDDKAINEDKFKTLLYKIEHVEATCETENTDCLVVTVSDAACDDAKANGKNRDQFHCHALSVLPGRYWFHGLDPFQNTPVFKQQQPQSEDAPNKLRLIIHWYEGHHGIGWFISDLLFRTDQEMEDSTVFAWFPSFDAPDGCTVRVPFDSPHATEGVEIQNGHQIDEEYIETLEKKLKESSDDLKSMQHRDADLDLILENFESYDQALKWARQHGAKADKNNMEKGDKGCKGNRGKGGSKGDKAGGSKYAPGESQGVSRGGWMEKCAIICAAVFKRNHQQSDTLAHKYYNENPGFKASVDNALQKGDDK